MYIYTLNAKEMIEEYSQIILTEIFGIKTVNLHLHFLSADTLVTSERFRRKLYYTKLPSTGYNLVKQMIRKKKSSRVQVTAIFTFSYM